MTSIIIKWQELQILIGTKKMQLSFFQRHLLPCSHQDRVQLLPFLPPCIAMSCLVPRGAKLKINVFLMPFAFFTTLSHQEGRGREQQIAQYFVEWIMDTPFSSTTGEGKDEIKMSLQKWEFPALYLWLPLYLSPFQSDLSDAALNSLMILLSLQTY